MVGVAVILQWRHAMKSTHAPKPRLSSSFGFNAQFSCRAHLTGWINPINLR